ncbi:MAG: glycine cleavage system aminomethyltransferase GcvT [Actinobacteria bacterium]|nr:MAG: glycine cleavage system aminomethyltransferase GcvT [Actinomycetota bacterium]
MSEELKRTPLYEEHLALGARMVPFAGWEMPVQNAGIIEEHNAVRSSAGIFDVCHMAEFRVFGFGAFDFLQTMFTNDLHRISELGQAQYTLMLDDEGGIIDDLIVYHSGDIEYLIIANASNREADFAWLQQHAPDDIELVDESDRTALIALQGPEAIRIITELAGDGWEAPARFTIREALIDNAVPSLIARTGYTGEDGVEIVCRASDAAAVWRVLLSFAEVTPAGLGARDTLRLEMGYHLYGNDMDRSVDPISAGLGWVCPKDKTGYVGAEVVARVRAEGAQRKLVHLKVDGGIPRPGFTVLHGGVEVGKVASGTFSPTLQTGIATAYVPAELATPGTELTVEIRKKTAPAVIVKAPFVSSTSLSGS